MDSVVTSPSVDVDLKMDYSLLVSKIAVSKYIAPQAALSLHRKSEVNFASIYPRWPKRHNFAERATVYDTFDCVEPS
jgi:predicted transcriptional regulator of viral defense system